jgi:threonine/homoserine/homoserine lactone efflux protein
MLEFAIAVFFLFVTPGPGVLSTAGIGSAFGARAGVLYVAGLGAGHNLVGLLVVTGVAAAALAVPWLRTVLLFASALYLLYLAGKIALAGSRIGFIHPQVPPGLVNGFTLQMINPKAYAVNTAIFSGFAFLPGAVGTEIALKFIVMNAIWIPIHALWLYAGVTVRRMELGARANRIINAGMALAMLAVVALAVGSQL